MRLFFGVPNCVCLVFVNCGCIHILLFTEMFEFLAVLILGMSLGAMRADELAKDVSGAEAILARHNDRKSQIDAHEESYHSTVQLGESLIQTGHHAEADIQDKVSYEVSRPCSKLKRLLLIREGRRLRNGPK